MFNESNEWIHCRLLATTQNVQIERFFPRRFAHPSLSSVCLAARIPVYDAAYNYISTGAYVRRLSTIAQLFNIILMQLRKDQKVVVASVDDLILFAFVTENYSKYSMSCRPFSMSRCQHGDGVSDMGYNSLWSANEAGSRARAQFCSLLSSFPQWNPMPSKIPATTKKTLMIR